MQISFLQILAGIAPKNSSKVCSLEYPLKIFEGRICWKFFPTNLHLSCSDTRQDKIINECIKEKAEVVPILGKIVDLILGGLDMCKAGINKENKSDRRKFNS